MTTGARQAALDVLLTDAATDLVPVAAARAAVGAITRQPAVEWLQARSGELQPTSAKLGNHRHTALAKAPGSDVHAS